MMHRKIKRSETNIIGGPIWLTTFNDMITLLMVFFVLLFTMGSIDVKRFKNFQNALQSAMGTLYAGKHAPIGTPLDRNADAVEPLDHSEQKQLEKQQFGGLDHTEGLEAIYTKKGIQLTLDDRLLFTSGSAVIKNSGKALLLKIGQVVKPLKRHIRVEGHTDSLPINTSRYPSNWELSTERAINVVKIFINEGGIPPGNLSAVGYGDVKPKSGNNSALTRSKNRRVEIILEQVKESPLLK